MIKNKSLQEDVKNKDIKIERLETEKEEYLREMPLVSFHFADDIGWCYLFLSKMHIYENLMNIQWFAIQFGNCFSWFQIKSYLCNFK